MMQFRKNVPSLTALVALEAAIRHRSVTAAARELGVTQAAVSRQIALLERELGIALFVRTHRAIEPTAACARLGITLANSFSSIVDGVEAVRSAAHPDVVTIGATLAFSAFWLLPRLSEFRQAHPDVQIRIVSQDSPLPLDGGVDIAIRYGTPPFPDGIVLASRGDTVGAVCAPDYARRRGARDPLRDPWRDPWTVPHDLIETDVSETGWYSWPDWFARLGLTAPGAGPSLRFNHYTETVSAARAGQGVALGWGVLVETFLQDGSLVRLGDDVLKADGQYNVLVPARAKPNGVRDVAAGWITEALHRRP